MSEQKTETVQEILKKTISEREPSYLHLEVGDGRATAAIRVSKGVSSVAKDIAYVGMAWCSPTDHFSRKRGRLIASGRVRPGTANYFYKIILDPSRKVGVQVIEKIEQSIETEYDALPRWLGGQ